MKSILLLTGCLILTPLSGWAQSINPNGDLEKWTGLEGNPPTGTPVAWGLGTSSTKPIRAPGLIRSSDYAAWMQPGDKNALAQGIASAPMSFDFEFLVAAEDPGSPTARSFNLSLNEKGVSTPSINLRLVQGNSAGKLTLQAFDGRAWRSVAEDAFEASVFNAERNTFTSLRTYRMQIKGRYDNGGTYSIAYGPENGELTTLADLHYYQTPPAGGGLSGFSFISGMSRAGFGIDNVTVR